MYGNNIFDLVVKKSDGKSEKIKVKSYIRLNDKKDRINVFFEKI